MQHTQNLAIGEIREEMVQMTTKLGLSLKYVNRGADKVNPVNYLTKSPSLVDDYYNEEDSSVVNQQTWGF